MTRFEMGARWFCELHRLTTTTDCPKCDDEQIADLEHYAKTGTYPPAPAACNKCRRVLRVGDTAWASDWTVIEPGGVRAEVRYICDDCEVEA